MNQDDDGPNPFAPAGPVPPSGPADTAVRLPQSPDPFAPPQPTLSPEEYVRDKVRRELESREGTAKRPFISTADGVEYGPQQLRESVVLDRYLRNGVGQLFSKDEIQLVIDVLKAPPIAGATLVGTEEEKEARRLEVERVIGELELEKASR